MYIGADAIVWFCVFFLLIYSGLLGLAVGVVGDVIGAALRVVFAPVGWLFWRLLNFLDADPASLPRPLFLLRKYPLEVTVAAFMLLMFWEVLRAVVANT
jgi:hypothetical protein